MIKVNEIRTDFRSCHSITDEIMKFVSESGVVNGLLTVNVPNTTTGLAITSFWDKLGLDDLLDEIDRFIPTGVNYNMQKSPYNSSGHVKSSVFKNSVNIAIVDGNLVLGSSQGVVLMDFDGPQSRDYILHITEYSDTAVSKNIQIETEYFEMIDIFEEVLELVNSSTIKNGVIHLSVLHSTAGLLLCSDNKSVQKDIMSDIERMIPTRVDFKHRETASDAAGHVKTALTGTQVTLRLQDGKLVIGEDLSIIFAEFDGPRPRKIHVAILEREVK